MPAVHETVEQVPRIDVDEYKYGFETEVESEKAPKGLSEDTVRFISGKKSEPAWMLEWRLDAYRRWLTMDEPQWARVDYGPINYQDIYYCAAPKCVVTNRLGSTVRRARASSCCAPRARRSERRRSTTPRSSASRSKRLSTSRFFPLCSWNSGVEKAHGRIEWRAIDVLPAEAAGIQGEWPTVRQICRVIRSRQVKKNGEWQKPQHEVVYLVSSLPAAASPQALLGEGTC